MTTAKAMRGVSAKRHYAYATNSTKRRDGCMPAAEINKLMKTWRPKNGPNDQSTIA